MDRSYVLSLIPLILLAIACMSLMAYAIYNHIVYDVPLSEALTALLAIASYVTGRHHHAKSKEKDKHP